MAQKSVRDLIFDKFVEVVGNDALFKGISDDLANLVRQGKPGKTDIINLLRKKQ